MAEAPDVPADISRFTSNDLFGQPGLYPQGPPMAPAQGEPLTGAAAMELLEEHSPAALAVYGSAELASVTPVPQVRAALALLVGGPAEPILTALLGGSAPLARLEVGPLAQPGRVLGDPRSGPEPGARWLNERYAAEHPAVVAPSLAHAICHHDTAATASNAEEATLHGVLAAVHAWLVAAVPVWADLGTELSRRQASLTITLLNGRPVGSLRPSIVCPDGPGTIPGGNPELQGPDLWSIPFTEAAPENCELAVPEAVRGTLSRIAVARAGAPPDTYGDELGDWLRRSVCGGVLDAALLDRAGRALGLWL